MVDGRVEEQSLVSHTPKDGSQTERSRGTYGGRQRWLVNGGVTDASTMSSRSSKTPRVTSSAVSSYLGSLGVGNGDEMEMMSREANEVATLRREYDTVRNLGKQKRNELRTIEEQLMVLEKANNTRKQDNSVAQQKVTKFEHKILQAETKLEDEVNDLGVYKHMIQRLLGEVQSIRKITKEKETEIKSLNHEITANASTLLAARQEKAAAEQVYKNLVKSMETNREDNMRDLGDLEVALQQTKRKAEIMERREQSRQQVMQEAVGEMSAKESTKLKQDQVLHKSQFREIQKNLVDTDEKLQALEADFRKIAEAGGTTDIDKIIAKFISRGDTFNALEKEYADSELKMKRLREKHASLKETLINIRGTTINTRGVYQEMDGIANQLKDIEKEAMLVSEKCNRVNVALEGFRSCMFKCLNKMSKIKGIADYGNDQKESTLSNDVPCSELVLVVEHKLNRVLEIINREKTELELRRNENVQGNRSEAADKVSSVRQPAAAESEEHFILRMSQVDVSNRNLRVGPSAANKKGKKVAYDSRDTTSEEAAPSPVEVDQTGDDDPVIDRHTRKKLAGMVVSRGKRGRKAQ